MNTRHLALILVLLGLMVACRSKPTVVPPKPSLVLTSPVVLSSPLKVPTALDLLHGEVILFASNRDGMLKHHFMKPDGKYLTSIDFHPALGNISGFVWWSKRDQFVVEASPQDNLDIYLTGLKGNDVINVTNSPKIIETAPVPSPDGQFIVMVCQYWDLDICLVRVDGSEFRYLTEHPARETNPAWSLSGDKIAFVSNREGMPDVFVMRISGEDLQNLSSSNSQDIDPSWSVDERSILFLSDRAGSWDVFTMRTDGSAVSNLTNNPSTDTEAKWSPSGDKIAFRSDRTGDWEIFVMSPDGTDLINVSNHPDGDELAFDWSPDGRYIVFTSMRRNNMEVFRVDRDGTNPVNLTNHQADDSSPVWFKIP